MHKSEQGSRVLEFRRSGSSKPPDLRFDGDAERPFAQTLAKLRAEMDVLALSLTRRHGRNSETALRAEQICHAIQRLEWALNREGEHPPAS